MGFLESSGDRLSEGTERVRWGLVVAFVESDDVMVDGEESVFVKVQSREEEQVVVEARSV